MKKIIFLSGSNRAQSFNTKLVIFALELAKGKLADYSDLEIEAINLINYPIPVFSQDLEAQTGLPNSAKKLKDKFTQASGLLIACPEHNSSYPACLKNTIDWISRKETSDEEMYSAFLSTKAAIISASPTVMGGARAVKCLSELLTNIKVDVLGETLSVPKVHELIKNDGLNLSQTDISKLKSVIDSLFASV